MCPPAGLLGLTTVVPYSCLTSCCLHSPSRCVHRWAAWSPRIGFCGSPLTCVAVSHRSQWLLSVNAHFCRCASLLTFVASQLSHTVAMYVAARIDQVGVSFGWAAWSPTHGQVCVSIGWVAWSLHSCHIELPCKLMFALTMYGCPLVGLHGLPFFLVNHRSHSTKYVCPLAGLLGLTTVVAIIAL